MEEHEREESEGGVVEKETVEEQVDWGESALVEEMRGMVEELAGGGGVVSLHCRHHKRREERGGGDWPTGGGGGGPRG